MPAPVGGPEGLQYLERKTWMLNAGSRPPPPLSIRPPQRFAVQVLHHHVPRVVGQLPQVEHVTDVLRPDHGLRPALHVRIEGRRTAFWLDTDSSEAS